MSNVEINPAINVDAYGWRCAASFVSAESMTTVASAMAAFKAFTHGVKRTPATAGRATVRAWNGPMT